MMPGAGPRAPDEMPRNVWSKWRQIQDWVFAGNREWGYTVAADHQFLTINDASIRAGMLRGTIYSPLRVVREGQPALSVWPQPGKYLFHYSFTSGKGDWAASKSWRAGMELNMPLAPVTAVNELSKKPLPPERSFFSIDADNLVLTAPKKTDRDEAVVLWVFEIRGDAAESPIRFLGPGAKFSSREPAGRNPAQGATEHTSRATVRDQYHQVVGSVERLREKKHKRATCKHS